MTVSVYIINRSNIFLSECNRKFGAKICIYVDDDDKAESRTIQFPPRGPIKFEYKIVIK